MTEKRRLVSVDVLRGATIALMVLVNNPGNWDTFPTFLKHAAWNGLQGADLVFPTFLFVMGVSMYLSFSKRAFRLDGKVLRRSLSLIGLGLLLSYLCQRLLSGLSPAESLRHLRYPGVLQRFGLCYGLCAVLICCLDAKWLKWIILALLLGYSGLLYWGHGYAMGEAMQENILSRVDVAVLGSQHLYLGNFDPEGLLSTLPALAHTLIGFLLGKLLAEDRQRRLVLVSVSLFAIGLGLHFVQAWNKQIWSPSFTLSCCGIAGMVLALLHLLMDSREKPLPCGFFKTYGCNAIFCYLLSEMLTILALASGVQTAWLEHVGTGTAASVGWALAHVLLVYLFALPLYRKKIYIKL